MSDDGVDTFRFAEWLHDPHSKLEIGHPDSEVWVLSIANIFMYEDDLPVVRIVNTKVYADLEVDGFEDPTTDQLDFWDLSNRILERFMWCQQSCTNCGHTLRMHLEQDADVYGCEETACGCVGHVHDLTP